MPSAPVRQPLPTPSSVRPGPSRDVYHFALPATVLPRPVVGLSIGVRQGSRSLRFVFGPQAFSLAAPAHDGDTASSIVRTIRVTLQDNPEPAIAGEILLLLRNGSLPVACDDLRLERLLTLLQRLLRSIGAH